MQLRSRPLPALLLGLSLALPLRAQDQDVLTPHSVNALRSVVSAAIAPDGAHVAYVRSVPRQAGTDEDGPAWAELHVLDVADGSTRPFVAGKVNVSGVEWTRDGQGIAFLAKRGDDKFTALYVIPLGGGEARRAAALASDIEAFSFSPDAQRVALVATAGEDEARKKARDKGFKQEVYEEDWQPSRVWIARAFDSQDQPRALDIEGSIVQVQWCPVDERLAVTVAPTPSVDDEFMLQRIRVVDAASGRQLGKLENPGKLGML